MPDDPNAGDARLTIVFADDAREADDAHEAFEDCLIGRRRRWL